MQALRMDLEMTKLPNPLLLAIPVYAFPLFLSRSARARSLDHHEARWKLRPNQPELDGG